ncbi:MAG: mechanosensitive ion channel family protein [Leptolyngbyaceae cyanobacterium bins.302]|nr:mechanosensitive ion channel family protein [Leptolyngbyaceae cyanobacterium bins.302]
MLRNQGQIWTYLRLIGMGLVAIAASLLAHPTWAQLPSLTPSTSTPTVAQVEFENAGRVVHASVRLDGREILQIAALDADPHQDARAATSPIQTRVRLIEGQLKYVVSHNPAPTALQASIGTLNSEPLITVSDAASLKDFPIMAVTDLDAKIHGIPRERWAEELREIVQSNLVQAIAERQPAYLQQQAAIAVGIFCVTLLLSGILLRVQRHLQARHQTQKALTTQTLTTASGNESDLTQPTTLQPNPGLELHQNHSSSVYKFRKYAIAIGLVLLWVVALSWIVGLFPQSRWAQTLILREPLLLLLIWSGSALAIRASRVFIDRFLAQFQSQKALNDVSVQRQLARLMTYSNVVKGIMMTTILGIATLLTLDCLQIPLAPVLAGAGILGFAISFGSQTLIKDVINGVLILAEDQFAVGDFVELGTTKGYVESVSLRVTRVRGAEGRLSTIPNSSISVVHNMTKDWARAEIAIEVAYNADVAQAMAVMQDVAKEMATDPAWSDRILDPVKLLGVSDISRNGVMLTIWIKTIPDAQWAIAREFRHRVKQALDLANIPISVPHQITMDLGNGNSFAIPEITSAPPA